MNCDENKPLVTTEIKSTFVMSNPIFLSTKHYINLNSSMSFLLQHRKFENQ